MSKPWLYEHLLNRYSPLSRDTRSAVGMGWGEKGHIEIVPGATIQSIELITDITAKTKIKRVSLDLNGSEIVALTGSDLKMLEAYKDAAGEDGRYVINFADMLYRTKNGIRSGELVTLPTDEINLFVELEADATGSAPAPTIRGRTWVTAAQPARYFIPKIYSTNYDASASGDNDLIWKNGSIQRFIRRIHFKTGTISRLAIWRDQKKVHDLRDADNKFDLKRNKLVPQTNYFHFDPTQLGLGLDGLFPTFAREELKFVLNKTSAGSVPMLVEMLEQVQALPVKPQAARTA